MNNIITLTENIIYLCIIFHWQTKYNVEEKNKRILSNDRVWSDGVWSDGVAVYAFYKGTAIYNNTYLEQRTLVRFVFLGLLVLDLCVYFVDRCLSFFFLSLCCLSFDLQILITLFGIFKLFFKPNEKIRKTKKSLQFTPLFRDKMSKITFLLLE